MESYETDTEQLHIAAGRDHRSLSQVVPLPKQALDILIVLNIAISIMILMITMSISEALGFSIFPSCC